MKMTTTVSAPNPIQSALQKPNGARFFRCALQVNPFQYVVRHRKQTAFTSEDDYNAALVEKSKKLGTEVLAVTDHYRIKEAEGLIKCARDSGLFVFPGFEAVTKEGIHLLCLFGPEKDLTAIDRIIGSCGIHDSDEDSPTGTLDAHEFLSAARGWDSVCIAAHVASKGGVWTALQGKPRAAVWCSDDLWACAIPGSIKDAPEGFRPVLENQNADYRRSRPIAVVNSQDVCSPEELEKPGATCWIKMSTPSVDGLRQAFLDPQSRIRLASDTPAEDHTVIVAMAWEGGFLNETMVHFNENLNCLIGGRGTGKSTLVESLRYVLGCRPNGDDAKQVHDEIVKNVLRAGTRVSVLIRSHHPAAKEYVIERTAPNPSIVRDHSGTILDILPTDVCSGIEIYGQHEISELTKTEGKLTKLLDRFVAHDTHASSRRSELRRELESNRNRIIEAMKAAEHANEKLSSLPSLEETLKRYEQAGLQQKLKQKEVLIREEQLFRTAASRVCDIQKNIIDAGRKHLPLDLGFLSTEKISALLHKELLAVVADEIGAFSRDLESALSEMETRVSAAQSKITSLQETWNKDKLVVDKQTDEVMRSLGASSVNAEEFLKLRQQIEALTPMRDGQAQHEKTISSLRKDRRNLLAELENLGNAEFRELEKAAKAVTRKLERSVRVSVRCGGDREPLKSLLKDIMPSARAAIDTIVNRDELSVQSLADACRTGREALRSQFGLTAAQADKLAAGTSDQIMQIEELELPATTSIELNVGTHDNPVWNSLRALSTGQKATAILLLLLLESDAPLIVDQPEDDLDNRFISESVVPKMRDEKRRRQFIFATHNANIPVLGDAELILGMTACGEADGGKAQIQERHMGSIDAPVVRELVEEVLEGGKTAFETRRLKYGF